MLKKLYSKKGQVSMEIGILVAAAVAVSAIASYFYAKNVKQTEKPTAATALCTSETLLNLSEKASDEICNLSVVE